MISERHGTMTVWGPRGRGERASGWQRWAPFAVAWSLAYAALGAYWAVSGRGFPFAPGPASDVVGPVVGRFGTSVAWAVVIAAGLPAATMGTAMLHGVRALRPLFIAGGALLAGVLLLLTSDVGLLALLGHTPEGVIGLLTGTAIGRWYLEAVAQWTVAHQALVLIGGFLWLGATVSYARRSGDACLSCGRRDGQEGWTSPRDAARWGRIAVYVAAAVPLFYALTRYAYALGIPLGISEEFLRRGQETGMWTSGLFLASFALLGAVLTLGLTQRWGEAFPCWMIGLAGRRVPIALAVVPASVASVLTIVGGIAMWSGLAQLVGESVTGGIGNFGIIGLAPTALFPLWGVALAVATLSYYYRQRGPCATCGRGALGEPLEPATVP